MGEKKQVFSHGHEFYANLGSATFRIIDEVLWLDKNHIIDRIWKKDPTVWSSKPDEIVNRLGWLSCTDIKNEDLDEIEIFVRDIREDGFNRALLLGMGGSSLAPEVLHHIFGSVPGYLNLQVLDSTDPAAVLTVSKSIDPARTLFIVATKSGGTIETISFLNYFYRQIVSRMGAVEAGKHFCAITDPGSSLERMARKLNFRMIFLNDPDIGGRYSALSHFGLVPAALMGISTRKLIERAMKAVIKFRGSPLPEAGVNTAAWLGAILGGFEKHGRNKLTILTTPALKYFGTWIEQLIVASTGKKRRGILPVVLEHTGDASAYRKDRIFVYIKVQGETDYLDSQIKKLEEADFPVICLQLGDLFDIGSEFLCWELATAVACALIKINPFDQPDVESAKVRAKEMMDAYGRKGILPELPVLFETKEFKVISSAESVTLDDLLKEFFYPAENILENEQNLPYISLQAYLNPSEENTILIEKLRKTIQEKYKIAVTAGFGPRFLHSTGQLHKGDSGKGLFIQIVAEEGPDCPIPADVLADESVISFRILKRAQALGDRQALMDAGRKIITFDLSGIPASGMKEIQRMIEHL
jgi:glucose-6-phosphate isomerase